MFAQSFSALQSHLSPLISEAPEYFWPLMVVEFTMGVMRRMAVLLLLFAGTALSQPPVPTPSIGGNEKQANTNKAKEQTCNPADGTNPSTITGQVDDPTENKHAANNKSTNGENEATNDWVSQFGVLATALLATTPFITTILLSISAGNAYLARKANERTVSIAEKNLTESQAADLFLVRFNIAPRCSHGNLQGFRFSASWKNVGKGTASRVQVRTHLNIAHHFPGSVFMLMRETGEHTPAVLTAGDSIDSNILELPLRTAIDCWEKKVTILFETYIEYMDKRSSDVIRKQERCILDIIRDPKRCDPSQMSANFAFRQCDSRYE